MKLYNLTVCVESDTGFAKTEILTQQPEEAVLDCLLSYGTLTEPVAERLVLWGKELRALPCSTKFAAGLPGGGRMVVVGSERSPHQLALDEG